MFLPLCHVQREALSISALRSPHPLAHTATQKQVIAVHQSCRLLGFTPRSVAVCDPKKCGCAVGNISCSVSGVHCFGEPSAHQSATDPGLSPDHRSAGAAGCSLLFGNVSVCVDVPVHAATVFLFYSKHACVLQDCIRVVQQTNSAFCMTVVIRAENLLDNELCCLASNAIMTAGAYLYRCGKRHPAVHTEPQRDFAESACQLWCVTGAQFCNCMDLCGLITHAVIPMYIALSLHGHRAPQP